MEAFPLSVVCPLFFTLFTMVASKKNFCTALHWTVFFPCFYKSHFDIDTLMIGWSSDFTTQLCPQQFGNQHQTW